MFALGAPNISDSTPKQTVPVKLRWLLLAAIGAYVVAYTDFGAQARALVKSLQGQQQSASPVEHRIQPTAVRQQTSSPPIVATVSDVPGAASTLNAASQTPTPIELTVTDPSKLVDQVVAANELGITAVLNRAEELELPDLKSLAKEAGRAFWFDTFKIQRDRKLARALNDQAIKIFYDEKNFLRANNTQYDAFRADPLDVEIASNLGIFSLRAGDTESAYRMAIYALSLPREAGGTGRTADWNTLAAALASRGDAVNSRNSLYVTLAIAPDIVKRCYSAVYSARNTYGDVLRTPTEQLFERIRDKGLSGAEECALPISW